ncbi:MAG: FdhF/YdeP family oxidoreductase [Frankiaceae bacterium]|nr:FdhF/YdeP family oxidoreductase [Frankiaceae bacterium]
MEQYGEDEHLRVGSAPEHAAGVPAVVRSLRMLHDQVGVARGTRALLRINQKHGFDCPGCAWPEGSTHRKVAEFCENGVKAVAEEATERRITEDFWNEHPVSDLRERSGYWLGQQGRLTQPVYKPPGSDHYAPIGWDDALDLVAAELRRLDNPDRAVFYTSGRTSNEAAYLFQLFVRAYGTNNLPDCSNMCHESSGSALTETIGVGKGTVSLEDIGMADLILVVGQNPGTNHPRMLTALAAAKRSGTSIVTINPLREAGMVRFKDPQRIDGVLGKGTELSDQYLQIRINGDLALFQALGRRLLDADAAAPGSVLDHDFITTSCAGFAAYAEHVRRIDDDMVRAAAGLQDAEIDELADRLMRSDRVIVCWAMGLTQHKNAVATIREIVNVLLLLGSIGRPGAGVCPVRGHSNVQGDRTMGIWDKPPPELLDGLRREFGFEPPTHDGCDVVESIRAMRDGKVDVLMAMGGNFVAATPDTAVTEDAVARCRLTVSVSTKLNRSHAVVGSASLILPTLGRTERDEQAGGPQAVTVEDSMSSVHLSQGRLAPASETLLSEVSIVCRLARRVLTDGPVLPWAEFERDYRTIRESIGRVVPGCAGYADKVEQDGGYVLANGPRDSRTFTTPDGKAHFTVNQLEVVDVPPGRLLLATIRSHDQYNTTIYGLDDHYRGIRSGRRVVFVHADDITALGFVDGQVVDLVSEWADGERRASGFRLVAYATPRGCAAAYFPETNVLVPLDSTADVSGTPTSKSIVIRLEAAR